MVGTASKLEGSGVFLLLVSYIVLYFSIIDRSIKYYTTL